MTIFALGVFWKICFTVVIGISGFALVVLFALFGEGADPETGEGSSSWFYPAILTIAGIALLWVFT